MAEWTKAQQLKGAHCRVVLGVDDPGFRCSPSNDGVWRILSCSALLPVKRVERLMRAEGIEGVTRRRRRGLTKRDAEARAKTEQLTLENEERRLKNAESVRSAWKDVTPDLGSVDRGTTSVKDDTVLFSTLLATRALEDAASLVAKKVTQAASGRMGVIVTTDADLVSRIARYRQALEQVEAVKTLVESVVHGDRDTDVPVEPHHVGFIAPASLVGAAVVAANLLPGVLGMISANRSVTSKDLGQDETTVAMAVTGAILGREPSLNVRMDRTRSLPAESRLMGEWEALMAATYQLRKRVAEEGSRDEDQQDADWLTDAKAVASLAQELVTGMTSVPQGATVSPLVAAVIEEFLSDGTPCVTY